MTSVPAAIMWWTKPARPCASAWLTISPPAAMAKRTVEIVLLPKRTQTVELTLIARESNLQMASL